MEMHRADARYRRQVLLALGASLLLGLAGLYWLNRWLAELIARGPMLSEDHLGLWLFTATTTGLLARACLVAGSGLWQLAGRIQSQRRYPPEDMRTARDVPVRRDGAADTLARRARQVAGLLFAAALTVAAWGGWMLYVLR